MDHLLLWLLLNFLCAVLAQDSTTTAEPDIDTTSPRATIAPDGTFVSCGTQSEDTFTYLDEAKRPFCFKFSNASTGSAPFTNIFYFGSRVDEYSLITLSGSNLGEVSSGSSLNWKPQHSVSVQFEAGGYSTDNMLGRYFDPATGKLWIFTQLSAVIILDQGKIDEITWDDGCYACQDENCIDGNCAIKQDDCQAGTNKCDFSAYISWYGTDLNGRYLLSAGQRLSQFQSSSAKSYYDYVKNNLDTDVIDFLDDEE